MSRLILDFLARRWWVVLVTLALSAAMIASGQALPFTPIALIVLIFDAQRGVIRVVRPLPVSRRAQAAAWWFLGVPLGTIVAGLGHAIGAIIYVQGNHPMPQIPVPTPEAALPFAFVTAPDPFSPWFVAATVTWVGLGYTALCFLLSIALPTRAASGGVETAGQGVVGALWGLSMSAPMLFMWILPKNPGAVHPWHWLLFAAVPVLALISFRAAPEMADRRMRPVTGGAKPLASEPVSGRPGLTGSSLFLATVLGRTVLILAFMGAVQFLVLKIVGHGYSDGPNLSFTIQMIVFAVIFGSMPGEMSGMRVLRALPLSTSRLAALLLVVPLTLGLACAVFITVAGNLTRSAPVGPLAFLAATLVIGGAGALGLAASLHMVSAARLLVLIGVAILAGFALVFATQAVLWSIVGGSAGIALAFLLLMRGLRRSNAFYQPRRVFGVNTGQPLGVP